MIRIRSSQRSLMCNGVVVVMRLCKAALPIWARQDEGKGRVRRAAAVRGQIASGEEGLGINHVRRGGSEQGQDYNWKTALLTATTIINGSGDSLDRPD
jgi:hypothetical protein